MTSSDGPELLQMRRRCMPLRGRIKASRASQRVGISICLALAAFSCGVTRAPIDTRSDPAALPNLRRASQALQERIAREKEHVTALNQQLAELRASEARVYAEVFEAETSYQRLRADADDVLVDVSAVESELKDSRRILESRRMEHQVVISELASLEADLDLQRQAGLEARREAAVREGSPGLRDGQVKLGLLRLEELRARWGVPVHEWAQLWSELGVWEPADALSAPEAPSEPLPPDSLPAPDGLPSGAEEGGEESSGGDVAEGS
jgi:hypothetical protein